MLKLYSYYRSSTSFRVRIVLNHKQLPYEIIPVHLLKNGGEQHAPNYLAMNPAGGVPILEHDGKIVTQSAAICEYLNEIKPEPPLFPNTPLDRAWIRSVCNLVACDIHPVNNLRVLNYVTQTLGADDEKKKAWYRHWVVKGFDALEKTLTQNVGQHCFGDAITMADVFVVPQVWSAYRYKIAMDDYPLLQRVFENAMQLPAFQQASPPAQPDAE